MFYYKITAKLEKADKSEEQEVTRPRDKNRILAEKICLETEGYNDRPFERYIFTAHITDKKAVCGVFSNEKVDTQWILSYLEALEIKHTKIIAEEITFSEISSLISKANRGGYVEDDDEILEKLKLCTLRRYNDNFEIVLEEEHSRKELLKQAKEILSSSLKEELQRIFASHTEKPFFGHPVHYILETDNRAERQKMLHIVLSALYQTGRLKSRRYTEIGFDRISRIRHRDLVASSVGGTVVLTHDGEDESDNEFSFHSVENHKLAMETMREFQNDVLTVLCLPKACNKLKEMLLPYVGNCVFVEIKEDAAFGECAKDYLRRLAHDAHITPDKMLYAGLSDETKGFAVTELRSIFEGWRNVKLRTKLYPQYSAMQSVRTQITNAKPNGSAYDELQKMIGLADAKKVMDRALNYYKAQKAFKDRGMASDHPVMHMVFTGNPGTAKTTVARLFAQIMKENGLLSEGKLYEVGRADLVGKYVGWTAQIVKELFKKAKGSVIFIDEAYSLLDDKSGMYGDEAINTIVQEMENHREDIVVIFAGYPKEMEQFLNRNPGLRSRIAYHVPFADYSAEELYQITELIASQKGMTLSAEVKDKLIPVFNESSSSEDFGNGRFVRNLVEQARMNQADRLIKSDWNGISKDTVTTLLPEDFEINRIVTDKSQERKIGFV